MKGNFYKKEFFDLFERKEENKVEKEKSCINKKIKITWTEIKINLILSKQ